MYFWGQTRGRRLASVIAICAAICMGSGVSAKTITTHCGGTYEIDPSAFRIYDIPEARFEELTGLPRSIQSDLYPAGRSSTKSAAATGKVLTIMIEWDNREANHFAHSTETYDSMLYSDGVYPTGSANDYYQEVSYGTMSLTGNAFGWFMLPTAYNKDYSITQIVNAANTLVDFSDYDADGNGKVDALWIIYAGTGENETHDPVDIWPHAVIGANVPTGDGVIIDRWSVQPEQHLNGDIMSIRVFCHEYGHIIGLPDLYDYDAKIDTVTYFTPNDANDHPVNDWDVMGYGGYAIMNYSTRKCPSHFSSWSRMELGWVNPVVPPCLSGNYELYNVEEYSTQSVFKIPISDDGLEYFLLEYRNPRSSAQFDHIDGDFSAYCPWFTPGSDTLDQGLLILHIDEHYAANNGTPSQAHYRVAVVDAGYKPSQPWNGSEITEWWYPYEFQIGALFSPDDPGQTQFTPSSVPSSSGHTGPSGITISVTSQNSDYLTLSIEKPIAPVLAAMPSNFEVGAGDSAAIPVSASDANCTEPTLLAGSLPSFVTLVYLGAGQGQLVVEPGFGDEGIWNISVIATDGAKHDTAQGQITVTPPSCECVCHADLDCNGNANIVDVVGVVNRAFRGGAAINDLSCPPHGSTVDGRADVDCTGATDIVDVVKMVDVAFRGVDPATKFCDPCL